MANKKFMGISKLLGELGFEPLNGGKTIWNHPELNLHISINKIHTAKDLLKMFISIGEVKKQEEIKKVLGI